MARASAGRARDFIKQAVALFEEDDDKDPNIISAKDVRRLWKGKMRKMVKRKPKKKRCRGVFLKGNPSVIALLKRIPALSVKVRDVLPSSAEGTCVTRALTVQSLLRRVPGLKRKLYTLFPR